MAQYVITRAGSVIPFDGGLPLCYDELMNESSFTAKEIWMYLHGNGWVAFGIYLILGWIATYIVRKLFRGIQTSRHLPSQVMRLLEKAIRGLIWAFVLVQGLRALGVDVVSILGAAGVAGVAIGFASQTALSNLISGIFLISESSFKIGDYVSVGGKEGTVESINLLSVYLRQPDNALVRIPCETLIKNPVTNITGDSMRRIDLDIGVDYNSNLEQVKKVILNVIDTQPALLVSPAPSLTFSSFGDSSLNLHIGAWCKTADYHPTRYAFATALLAAFKEAGINIPFPVRTVHLEKEA